MRHALVTRMAHDPQSFPPTRYARVLDFCLLVLRRLTLLVAARFEPLLAVVFGFTRSGSFLPPVSRFHSSNVSAEISPFTSNSANFRRCAWLLKGIIASLPPCCPISAGLRADPVARWPSTCPAAVRAPA